MSAPGFLNPPGRPSTVGTMQQVRELADWILNADRMRPLIVLTPQNTGPAPYFAPRLVLPLVKDAGDIVVIEQHREHAHTRELQRLLPSGLSVFNGAARIYWPIATVGTDPLSHPLVRADGDTSSSSAKRNRLANRWREGPMKRSADRPVRPATTRPPAHGPKSEPSGSVEELAYLEIVRAHLRLLGADQRARFPLRPHLVHPDLVAQLKALEPARTPVAEAAACVLSGYAWTQPSPVPLRVEREGLPVLRDDDQAVAWRFPLQGSDRHLFYWQPADGPVVLVRIAEVSYTGQPASAAAPALPATSEVAERDTSEVEAPVSKGASRGRGSFTLSDDELVGALRAAGRPLMVAELRAALQIPDDVSADIVRRVLDRARDRGVITRTGVRRGTRYSAQ